MTGLLSDIRPWALGAAMLGAACAPRDSAPIPPRYPAWVAPLPSVAPPPVLADARAATGSEAGAPPRVAHDAVAPPAASTEAAATPPPAPLRYPFHDELPARELDPEADAMRLANLSPSACRRALRDAKLPVAPIKGYAKGVANPVRIHGPIHGVRFVTPHAPSPYGVLDCRLALVLARLAEKLASFQVVAVRIDNMHRPHARLPGRRKPSQHSYGLAADIMSFELADGRTLNVERDWQSGIGASPCGPEAHLEQATEEAIALRTIACAVARDGLFHHMLTPSYDAAHRNHFHFDIKRDARRSLIR